MHKLLLERDPISGEALASQPTLSRFENALGPKTLMRMGSALADTVIARHRRRLRARVKRITLELDPTDDPTHCERDALPAELRPRTGRQSTIADVINLETADAS